MSLKRYFVYVLTNRSGTLYIGMTNDLYRRMYEHKNKLIPGFTSKYNNERLVYYEETDNVNFAIEREKQLKRWRRDKKVWLIERENPRWKDLAEDWY